MTYFSLLTLAITSPSLLSWAIKYISCSACFVIYMPKKCLIFLYWNNIGIIIIWLWWLFIRLVFGAPSALGALRSARDACGGRGSAVDEVNMYLQVLTYQTWEKNILLVLSEMSLGGAVISAAATVTSAALTSPTETHIQQQQQQQQQWAHRSPRLNRHIIMWNVIMEHHLYRFAGLWNETEMVLLPTLVPLFKGVY